jgi:hypothetical protein
VTIDRGRRGYGHGGPCHFFKYQPLGMLLTHRPAGSGAAEPIAEPAVWCPTDPWQSQASGSVGPTVRANRKSPLTLLAAVRVGQLRSDRLGQPTAVASRVPPVGVVYFHHQPDQTPQRSGLVARSVFFGRSIELV